MPWRRPSGCINKTGQREGCLVKPTSGLDMALGPVAGPGQARVGSRGRWAGALRPERPLSSPGLKDPALTLCEVRGRRGERGLDTSPRAPCTPRPLPILPS